MMLPSGQNQTDESGEFAGMPSNRLLNRVPSVKFLPLVSGQRKRNLSSRWNNPVLLRRDDACFRAIPNGSVSNFAIWVVNGSDLIHRWRLGSSVKSVAV